MITPEQITWEYIRSTPGSQLRADRRRDPAVAEAIDRVIAEQASAHAERVAAKTAELEETQQPVRYQAPIEQPVVEVPEVAQPVVQEPIVPELPKKIVVDYQVTDEDGTPIGRPTHLEAATEQEMRAKIIEAHTQATRAFHRLKKQKISFKETPPAAPQPSSDAELLAAMEDLQSPEPSKRLEAIRKVQKSERDQIESEYKRKEAEINEARRQEQVSFQFLNRHKNDFNNCQANVDLIKEYFVQSDPPLAWTLDNLEIALSDLESRLAPVDNPVMPVSVTPPVSPAVVPVAQPVVQQPVQAVVPTPVVAPPANNPPAAAPRPGVNGGIVPGESSGSRPAATKSNKLTAEEVASWSVAESRAVMRDPIKRARFEQFVRERNAAKQR